MIFNPHSCELINASDLVIRELERMQILYASAADSLPSLVQMWFEYLNVNDGLGEQLRRTIERRLRRANPNCDRYWYRIGTNRMDPSGIGNIAYGYTTGFYDIPIALAEGFAALKQGQNAVTMAEIEAQCGDDYFCQFKAILRIGDNDDDVVQIGIGYDLGQLSGRGFVPDATLLEDLAQNHGLY